MSAHLEQMQTGQAQLRASLRELTETALQYDNDRLPALLKSIGAIANASVELEELTREEIPVAPAQAKAPAIESVPVVEPIITPESVLVEAQAVKQPAKPNEEQVSPPQNIYEALPEEYHPAVRYMISHAGEVLKPGDITANIPDLTVAKRKHAMHTIISALKSFESEYEVTATGEKRGRRYVLEIIEQALSVSEPLDDIDTTVFEPVAEARPTPLQMPPRRPVLSPKLVEKPAEEEQVFTLTNWGLEFALNGHKEIKLNGQKLKIREAAVDTLLELAQHEEGVAFHELIDKLKSYGRTFEPTFLNGILLELKNALDTHATAKWTDEIRADEDGGTRFVRLAGCKPQEDMQAFLFQLNDARK